MTQIQFEVVKVMARDLVTDDIINTNFINIF